MVKKSLKSSNFVLFLPKSTYLRPRDFFIGKSSLSDLKNFFFDQVKEFPSLRNLIVDLRNNGGGGSKASESITSWSEAYSQTEKSGYYSTQKTASMPNR